MFISDLRRDFYDKVKHSRVLILAAVDVDSVCVCKILQNLFECDHTQYTVVPVTGKSNLETAFVEYSEQINHIIFINCGANVDLVEVLEPDDEVTLYVLDSHRPIDVSNIYNSKQVLLLMNEGEEEEIPSYEDVFRDSDNEDDDSDVVDDDDLNESDSLTSPKKKKSKGTEEELMKRRERRMWEEKRLEILFNYTQFSYYSTASSTTAYELAWRLSRDNMDILWWGILGLTEQYYKQQIDNDKYMQDSDKLQMHVDRLNRHIPAASSSQSSSSLSIKCMKISYETEISLYLYRHWSVYESILHSEYTSCQLKLWTVRGMKQLHELLANIGLPLVQVKQVFNHMDTSLKDNIKDWIESHAPKYGLDHILYRTFHTQYGYKHHFSAMDFVLAVSALLELSESHGSCDQRDNFLKSLDSLSRDNVNLIYRGINLAKQQLKSVLNTVHTFVNTHQILSAGPFLYVIIPEGNVDGCHFTKPSCLYYLARFLRNAQVVCSKKGRAGKLPLILAVPYNREEETCILIGIPPLMETSNKNFFGKAFEHAADVSKSRTSHNNFESSIIEIKNEDLSKFFDALTSTIQPT